MVEYKAKVRHNIFQVPSVALPIVHGSTRAANDIMLFTCEFNLLLSFVI